ncbi:cyclase [Streptomyces nanshensis]|uniref:Cyclase n=2 Tax=Streptomyces TaxID=1883 RepID=A0A1E7KWZ1_9ACTN|nr:cyclase [Streptomyces nanshensis]
MAGRNGSRFVDLSHDIVPGSTAYPGLPQPSLTDYISREQSREMYAEGTEFHTAQLCLVGQTGTYLDVPFHRYADGYDLTRLDLNRVANVPAVVIDTDADEIPPSVFAGQTLTGRAVLLRTGWSRFWGMDAYQNGGHPHLSEESARVLADAGPAVVGIDSLNIDGTHTGERPAHTQLLGAGIPIVEHLTNLGQLPGTGARFTAAPVKVVGCGTFPVRAFATWSRWV